MTEASSERLGQVGAKELEHELLVYCPSKLQLHRRVPLHVVWRDEGRHGSRKGLKEIVSIHIINTTRDASLSRRIRVHTMLSVTMFCVLSRSPGQSNDSVRAQLRHGEVFRHDVGRRQRIFGLHACIFPCRIERIRE